MKKFKRLFSLCMVSVFIMPLACKEEPVFVAPTYVFLKWSRAIKNLDYKGYSRCEYLPKTKEVFMDIYGKAYFDDVFVHEIGAKDEDSQREDKRGYRYELRKVLFECKRVVRKNGKGTQFMRGNVDFIKFMEGPDVDRGWMMFNRTITRTGFSQ